MENTATGYQFSREYSTLLISTQFPLLTKALFFLRPWTEVWTGDATCGTGTVPTAELDHLRRQISAKTDISLSQNMLNFKVFQCSGAHGLSIRMLIWLSQATNSNLPSNLWALSLRSVPSLLSVSLTARSNSCRLWALRLCSISSVQHVSPCGQTRKCSPATRRNAFRVQYITTL